MAAAEEMIVLVSQVRRPFTPARAPAAPLAGRSLLLAPCSSASVEKCPLSFRPLFLAPASWFPPPPTAGV